jgi:hypothetical protein
MKVRHKSHLQVAGLECSDAPFENGGLGATHNAGSEIDKIGAPVHDDGGRRTGTVGIGHRRTGAEEYYLRPARADFGA